jgi:hypothetical protein
MERIIFLILLIAWTSYIVMQLGDLKREIRRIKNHIGMKEDKKKKEKIPTGAYDLTR